MQRRRFSDSELQMIDEFLKQIDFAGVAYSKPSTMSKQMKKKISSRSFNRIRQPNC